MSLSSDLRSYADTAVAEGKKALDTAQAQLNDVTGQANDIVGKYLENLSSVTEKATEAVADLRTSAEKAINLDAVLAAIEPYLAQAKGYQATVTEKAEELLSVVKDDPRVAQLVESARPVVETLQERVVKPVQSLTGIGVKPTVSKPASSASKPAAKPAARKPATTKPATKPAAKPAPAKARPSATKATPAKTTPAKTTPAKATPAKASATKAPASKASPAKKAPAKKA